MKRSIKTVSLILTVLMVYGSTIAFIPQKAVFADEGEEVVEAEETQEIPVEDVDEFVEIIEEEIFDIEDEDIVVDPALFEEEVFEEDDTNDVTDSETEVTPEVTPDENPSAKVPEEVAPKTQIEEFIERCYLVTLNRTAGSGAGSGLEYWSTEISEGRQTGVSTVYNFFNSNEYKNKNKSNADYVKDLYKAFMGRDVNVNVGGPKFWVDQLNSGVSKEKVFSGFANSVEFYNICKSYGICAGTYIEGKPISQVAKINLFVNRLYVTVFGRNGDKGGVNYWTEQLIYRKMDGAKVAYNFLFGPEYRNLVKTNTKFVNDLYSALMGRTVSVTSTNYWVQWLNEDAYDIDVFNGFISSPEFSDICTNYGITRGASFDKFSMEYESCFARDTARFTAPLITVENTTNNLNFASNIYFKVSGFHGKFRYYIYSEGELITWSEYSTYMCSYHSNTDEWSTELAVYTHDPYKICAAGTYDIVVKSTLGYTLGKFTVEITWNYNDIPLGGAIILYRDEVTYNARYDGFQHCFDCCDRRGQTYLSSYTTYDSSCTRMSYTIVTDNYDRGVRYDWYYSPDNDWDTRVHVGLSGSVFYTEDTSLTYYNGSYVYEFPYSYEPTTIPDGTYWCVITNAHGEELTVARTTHGD